MLKKIKAFVCALMSLLFLVSCSVSAFDDFQKQFMNEYYNIIQNIDANEVDLVLEKLQKEENSIILSNMDKLLIDNRAFGNRDKYKELKEIYSGLIELKGAYGKWETLDLDKQQYLNEQLSIMYAYLSQVDYEKKHGNE